MLKRIEGSDSIFPPVSALLATSLVVADRALVMVAALLVLLMLSEEELLLSYVPAATRMPLSSEGGAVHGGIVVVGVVVVGDSRDAVGMPSVRECEREVRRENGVRLDRTEAEWTAASLVESEGECRDRRAVSLWLREMKGIWMAEREEEFW